MFYLAQLHDDILEGPPGALLATAQNIVVARQQRAVVAGLDLGLGFRV